MSEPLISIIDDDESVRLALEGLIRSLGFRAAAYPSAEAFLTAEEHLQARCIITDIQMPGMSGIELKRRLVSDGCDAPVIMITARAEGQLHLQAKACGAFCFLKKPFEAADLIACIERALAS